MNIERPDFACPVLIADHFLGSTESENVLKECIELKKVYMPAKIADGPSGSKLDLGFRRNDVVYLDDIFSGAPERSDILSQLSRRVQSLECKELWAKHYLLFDIINYATRREVVVSRYGHGGGYKKHRDTIINASPNRLVTLVYYVNLSPSRFSGGDLVLWEAGSSLRISPKHDRLVAFPSAVYHEVEEVQISEDAWEYGRFSINYWLGFNS
jgi:hypothetical protein